MSDGTKRNRELPSKSPMLPRLPVLRSLTDTISSPRFRWCSITWKPMNPAPPVTKLFTGLSSNIPYAARARLVGCWRFCFWRVASIAKNYVYQVSPSNSLMLLPSGHWQRNVKVQAEEHKAPAALPESQAPSIFPPAKLSPATMRGAGRSKESAGGPSGRWAGMA